MRVCLSSVNVAPTGQINVKFGIGTFMEKLSININIVFNPALYVTTKVGFIVTGYCKSPCSEMLSGC
jgi:hypothetical protein